MEIEKRIENLEDRFKNTEDKVAQLDKNIAVYSAIFERNLQIQEKLSNSIDKLSETIVGIRNTLAILQRDMKSNSDAQEGNTQKITKIEKFTSERIELLEVKLHEKLDGFAKELNEVDDKGKFDILKFIKDNFISFVLVTYIIIEKAGEFLTKKP